VKVCVIKNNSLGQIRWEQMVFLGNPEYACDLQPIDFAAIARACGATGITVDDPKMAGEAVERAFATEGPVVIEAVVDPNEPPLPPKITAEQARHFAEAMLRGEKDRSEIVATVLKDKIREYGVVPTAARSDNRVSLFRPPSFSARPILSMISSTTAAKSPVSERVN
jgi:pyruvate dehydrogenase (quinone)